MSIEETVAEKLRRLVGAARDAYLTKWMKWIKDMIPANVDPAVIIGSPKLTLDVIESILLEYCEDLTESECYRKLVEVFTYTVKDRGPILDKAYVTKFETKAKMAEAIARKLKLPWTPNVAVVEELYRMLVLGINPDPDRICDLLRTDVKLRWGALGVDPPEQDIKIVERVCQDVRRMYREKAKPIEWFKVLEPVFRTREELEPTIKPWISRLKLWGLDRDISHLVKGLTAKDIIFMAGREGIERILPNIRVYYRGDGVIPADLLDPERLNEFVKRYTGRSLEGIYAFVPATRLNELWYFNKFYINDTEIPLQCVYDKSHGYIIACDRPVIGIEYLDNKVKATPIVYMKMVRELERLGFYVEPIEKT